MSLSLGIAHRDNRYTLNVMCSIQTSIDMFYGMYKTKTTRKGRIHWVAGGSGEIRTHERLPVAGFQDRCNRPLCHAS